MANKNYKQPGTGPARKPKQSSGSHCPGGSGAPSSPGSSQSAISAKTGVPVNATTTSGVAVQTQSAPAPVMVAAPAQGAKAVSAPAAPVAAQAPAPAAPVAAAPQNPPHGSKQAHHNNKGGKRQKWQQSHTQQQITAGVAQFTATRWYLAAVKAGFKNKIALDQFNAIVYSRRADIDPMQVPVCMECGQADAILCGHFVVAAGVESQPDGAIAIPAAQGFAIRWRFNWVNRVKRMFTWPRFDSDALINHYNRGFDPSQISDGEVWPELLCYIRLNLMTEYKIDGQFNRKAKLAHCQKLASRFFTDFKIKQEDLLLPSTVNKIKLTVARACDQRDDQTLFKEVDPRWNFWVAPGNFLNLITPRRLVLVAAIISPLTVASLVNASLRLKLYCYGQLVVANAEILANGSVQIFWSLIQTGTVVVSALARNIFNGIVMPFWNQIRPSSWRAALTTSTSPYISDISRTLLSHSPSALTADSYTASLRTLALESSYLFRAHLSFLTERISLSQRLVGCARVICAHTMSFPATE